MDTFVFSVGPVPFKDVVLEKVLDGASTTTTVTTTTDISTTCSSLTLFAALEPDTHLRQVKDVVTQDDGGVIPLDAPTPTTRASPTTASTLQQYQGMWLPSKMITALSSVQPRFKSRTDDVLLASARMCGTTWLKALSFATMALATYPPSDADHPLRRLNPHGCIPVMENLFGAGQEAKLEALPSPRLLHTHFHYSLLPDSLADCKIIFVCREPKDMLVSMWYYEKAAGSNFQFSHLFERACQGHNSYGPSWDHVLGYWTASKASTDMVMFLRYEEMLVDPVGTVRQLALFLGVPFTADEEAAGLPADIAELCSIDALRGIGLNAKKTSTSVMHQSLYRKGVVGDWVNHMTSEMARRFDAIVEDKLQGSGLTFMSVPTIT